MLVGVAYSVFARTRTPDRVFGMLLVVQYGLGGLGIMVLPRLVPLYGARRAVRRADRVQLRHAPDAAVPRDYPRGRVRAPVPRRAASATACSPQRSVPCSCSRPATWGSPRTCWGSRGTRLDADFASTALGGATWIGIAGAALVVVFGTRSAASGRCSSSPSSRLSVRSPSTGARRKRSTWRPTA